MSFLSEELIYQKSPQELTMLLYEACERNIEEALQAFDEKDYIEVNFKLQRAVDIIERLGAGLNYEAGIIADQLDQVYNYMSDTLIEANVKKDRQKVETVLRILRDIATAWKAACDTQEDKQTIVTKQRTNAYEQNMMYDNE
ncbi:flagellar export chaperone FliS [Aliibacillus thermotolerans]|uniref:Flagellar secretion chaperone FliS n=1 Tax=Aliibacillus thermotolerans TaxID=1834418 RepID=A0ABW0UAE8_9BACI|nr:flagellar export chaperone FliS [Aliibacillus thermotolerans]MDA3131168.1 flagellar export chaperone FliS [Aliibacillus thermotolerans]